MDSGGTDRAIHNVRDSFVGLRPSRHSENYVDLDFGNFADQRAFWSLAKMHAQSRPATLRPSIISETTSFGARQKSPRTRSLLRKWDSMNTKTYQPLAETAKAWVRSLRTDPAVQKKNIRRSDSRNEFLRFMGSDGLYDDSFSTEEEDSFSEDMTKPVRTKIKERESDQRLKLFPVPAYTESKSQITRGGEDQPVNRVHSVTLQRLKTFARHPRSPMYNIRGSAETLCKSSLLPSRDWKMAQIRDFENARRHAVIERKEPGRSAPVECKDMPIFSDPDSLRRYCRQHEPNLKCLIAFDQRKLLRLLSWLSYWLHEKDTSETWDRLNSFQLEMPSNGSSEQHIPPPLNLLKEDRWLGEWLYTCMTCLRMPLHSIGRLTLRNIAGICLQLRRRLEPQQTVEAQPYNLFLTLIAKVFDETKFNKFI